MSKIVKRFIKPSGSERIAADSNAESTSSASDSAVETVAAGKPIYSSFPTRFSFESLRSKQENWLTNGGRNIWFKALEFQLLKHDMSHHTMEIINNSHGPLFESASCLNASSGSSASDSDTDTATDASGRWTVEWMCRWLTTLKCFDVCSSAPAGSKGCGSNGCPSVSDLPLLVYIFRRNCIDRDAFLDLAYADWVEFIVRLHRDFASGKVRESVKVCEFCSVARFDALSARLLKIFGILTKVRDGWLGDARLGIPVPCAAPPDLSAPGILSQRSGPVPMDCSEGASQASERDGGVCFGRLVVLGHKEARHVAASGSGVTATPARFQPIGLCNETLELRRRSVFAPGGPPRGLVLPHLGASSATAAAAAPSTSTNTNTNTSQKRSSLFSTSLLTRGYASLMGRDCAPSRTRATPGSAAGGGYVAAQANMQPNYFDRLGRNCNGTKRGGDPAANSAAVKRISYPREDVDVYQIGRASCGAVDFVTRGRVHQEFSRGGELRGPVSKYACRIECSRSPPYTCSVFAGGSDLTERGVEVMLGEHAPRWWCPTAVGENILDGFTTYGVRVFHPELGEWFEVSARGLPYRCRPAGQIGAGIDARGSILLQAAPTARISDRRFGNVLTDGSLIDIGGVTFLFRAPPAASSPSGASAATAIFKAAVLRLNLLRPYCPVLFSRLRFVFTSQRARALKAMRCPHDATTGAKRFIDLVDPAGCRNYSPDGRRFNIRSFRVPAVDHSGLTDETQRPYVFPACGHVFGFHGSFDSKPCPLCRHRGPFVPVLFEQADPLLSGATGQSTKEALPVALGGSSGACCVFNPCGHVASQELCERWAAVDIRVMNCGRRAGGHARPKCPFCSVILCREGSEGGPFNKLLFQSEEPVAASTPAVAAFSPTSVAQRRYSGADNISTQQETEPALSKPGSKQHLLLPLGDPPGYLL